MGRHPIPKEIKALQGTLEKSRELDSPMLPEKITDMEAAPPYFTEIQTGIWDTVSVILFDCGVLANTDLYAFTNYCFWQGLSIELQKDINISGTVRKDGKLTYSRSEFINLVKADNQAMSWGARLGLSPADRQKISADIGKENDDLID